MLVLTGTNGNLGSRVLGTLLRQKLIPPSQLIISSSNPSKVSSVAKELGVDIREGDFTSPQSLTLSFQGANALFLVSYPSPSVERWLHHKAAIDAAMQAGVKTVIYSSLMFGGKTGMQSTAGVQQAHIKTIDYLKKTGLQYVIMREGVYAESWWLYAGFQPRRFKKGETGDINFVIPNDGPVSWVTWDDLGEATAKILQNHEKCLGQTLNLTGPRATSISDVAKVVEQHTGRSVKVDIVGREKAEKYHKEKKSLLDSNFWVIESWAGWHDAVANGETAVVDPLIGELLGRSPRGIEEIAGQLFAEEE